MIGFNSKEFFHETSAISMAIPSLYRESGHATFVKFKKHKALTRDMLTELVERIIIHGADSIEIVWRYADEYKAVCELAKAGEQ